MVAPTDERSVAVYTLTGAAKLAGTSPRCVGRWMGSVWSGEVYGGATGRWRASYYDTVAAFIVQGLRRVHGYSLQKIRRIQERGRGMGYRDILLHKDLMHDCFGKFYIDTDRGMCDLDGSEQYSARGVVRSFLVRVSYDEEGWTNGFYPTVVGKSNLKHVFVSPRVAFGSPVIKGTRIRTSSLAAYYLAGDDPEYIMNQFGVTRNELLQALWLEIGDEATKVFA